MERFCTRQLSIIPLKNNSVMNLKSSEPRLTGIRASRLEVLALVMLLNLAVTNNLAYAQQQQTVVRPRQATQGQQQTTPLPPPPPPKPKLTQPPASQNPATTVTPTPKPATGGEELGDDEVINVDTSLINLQVRVVDRLGRPSNNLRKEDFRVFEDGTPQEVAFFSTEEVPVSYGMAIDTSRSLAGQIVKVIEASKAIVESNKPGDETVLITFRKDAELIQDFTSDKNLLLEKLDDLYVNAGQTAVIDAVYLASEYVATRKVKSDADLRRRALILVTDGEERGSQYAQDELFKFLREQGVQIYVIGFVKELDEEGGFIKKSPRKKAVELINRLAKETGGRAFFPESVSELPKIAEEITRDLRTQYVIGYQPTNKARDGRYRSVRVTVGDAPDKQKRIALTRSGYTPGREGVAPQNSPANSNTTPKLNDRRNN